MKLFSLTRIVEWFLPRQNLVKKEKQQKSKIQEGLSIPHLVDVSFSSNNTPITVAPKSKEEHDMASWGSIYARQRCPLCGQPFQRSKGDVPIICPTCKTHPTKYYIEISWHGKNWKISLNKKHEPLLSWEWAQATLFEIRTIGRKRFDPTVYHEQTASAFSSAWDIFIKKYEERPGTYHKIKAIGKHHLLPFFEGFQMHDIRALDIDKWWSDMKKKKAKRNKNLSPKYLNDCNQWLRRFFTKAYALNIIDDQIRSFPDFDPIEQKPIRWYTEEEQLLILEKIPKYDRKIFDFMFLTGCRVNEATGLQKADTDWKKHRTVIKHTIRRDKTLGPTKAKKPRVIPHFKEIEGVLKQEKVIRLNKDFVSYQFINKWGRRYSDDYLQDRLDDAVIALGLERLPLKNAGRSSFGMDKVAKGFNKYQIQEAFGHSSIKMTEHYIETYAEGVKMMYGRKSPTGLLRNKK